MLGVKMLDGAGNLLEEFHGDPPLPRAVAPGESVALTVKCHAPQVAGAYTLKIDLVDQHICWFEDKGSTPLILHFEVG